MLYPVELRGRRADFITSRAGVETPPTFDGSVIPTRKQSVESAVTHSLIKIPILSSYHQVGCRVAQAIGSVLGVQENKSTVDHNRQTD